MWYNSREEKIKKKLQWEILYCWIVNTCRNLETNSACHPAYSKVIFKGLVVLEAMKRSCGAAAKEWPTHHSMSVTVTEDLLISGYTSITSLPLFKLSASRPKAKQAFHSGVRVYGSSQQQIWESWAKELSDLFYCCSSFPREEKSDTSRATQKVTEIPMNRSQLCHDPGKGCDH